MSRLEPSNDSSPVGKWCDAPSPSKVNQPKRFSIPLLHKKMKKGPLPPLDLWHRLVDKSLVHACLGAKICSGSLLHCTKLPRASYYTVLSRSGYIVVYEEVGEGMEMGYAFDVTSAKRIKYSQEKITLKWKFGKLVLYPSPAGDDDLTTGLNSLLDVIFDAAARSRLTDDLEERYYGRGTSNDESPICQVHYRPPPLERNCSTASPAPLKCEALVPLVDDASKEGGQEMGGEKKRCVVKVKVNVSVPNCCGSSSSDRPMTASVLMNDEQLAQLHSFLDHVSRICQTDGADGTPNDLSVTIQFSILCQQRDGAINSGPNARDDDEAKCHRDTTGLYLDHA